MKTLAERLNEIAQSEELYDELYDRALEVTKQDAAMGDADAIKNIENEDFMHWMLPDTDITETTIEMLVEALKKDSEVCSFFFGIVNGHSIEHQIFWRRFVDKLIALGRIEHGQSALRVIDKNQLSPEGRKDCKNLVREYNCAGAEKLEQFDVWDIAKRIDAAVGNSSTNILTVYLIAYILRRHADLWTEFQLLVGGE
jgi:hypothetical protein